MDVLRKQGILFFVIENRVCSVVRCLLNDSKLGRLFFYSINLLVNVLLLFLRY